MGGRLPDFVVIGAQKAASTAVLHSLRQHPEVFMPPEEDPYFRDPLFDKTGMPAFARGYAGRTERVVGIKCPDYLGRQEVPERLRTYLGSPRLIAVLRNPIDRAVSAYYWHVRWGLLPVEDVNVGLRRVLAGDHPTDPTAPDILDWGLYHHHLTRYLEHFDRDQLLVLQDADLRRDPATVYRRVFDFLGVDPHFAPTPISRSGVNEGVYSLPRLRFLQRRNDLVLTWHESGTYGNIHPAYGVRAKARSMAVAGFDRYVLSRLFGNDKPELDADLRAELEDYYREDSRALADLLGSIPQGWPA